MQPASGLPKQQILQNDCAVYEVIEKPATSALGPTRTSRHIRFSAALGGEADISRRMQTDTIYEYAPYADEYTLFASFDRLLQECEHHGLQMT
jgi:hypothetical protein